MISRSDLLSTKMAMTSDTNTSGSYEKAVKISPCPKMKNMWVIFYVFPFLNFLIMQERCPKNGISRYFGSGF